MSVGESVCTGVGQNKKLAKRVAAEQMLVMLGYSLTPPPPPPPVKPALKPSNENVTGPAAAAATVMTMATGSDKHVTFAEREPGTGMQSIVYTGTGEQVNKHIVYVYMGTGMQSIVYTGTGEEVNKHIVYVYMGTGMQSIVYTGTGEQVNKHIVNVCTGTGVQSIVYVYTGTGACFEINFSDRQEGLTVSSITCEL